MERWLDDRIKAKLEAFAEIMGAEVGLIEKRFNTELKRLEDKIAALESGFLFERRHAVFHEDPSKFLKLILTDRFADYHSDVHGTPFRVCRHKA